MTWPLKAFGVKHFRAWQEMKFDIYNQPTDCCEITFVLVDFGLIIAKSIQISR